MDWNSMFQEANDLYNEEKYSAARRIYEQVAEGTMHPAAIRMTIITRMLNAYQDMAIVDSGMEWDIETCMADLESTMKWILLAKQNPDTMLETPDEYDDEYRTCIAFKEKYLSLLNK